MPKVAYGCAEALDNTYNHALDFPSTHLVKSCWLKSQFHLILKSPPQKCFTSPIRSAMYLIFEENSVNTTAIMGSDAESCITAHYYFHANQANNST